MTCVPKFGLVSNLVFFFGDSREHKDKIIINKVRKIGMEHKGST